MVTLPLWLVLLMGSGDLLATAALAWLVAIFIEWMRSGALSPLTVESASGSALEGPAE